MRRLLLVLGFLTAGLSTLAQTLPCRYWFDQNDGEAQQAVVVDGALQLPAGLPEGFHVVYMQLGSDSMSSIRSHLFYAPILTSTWSESVQYTYWFDRDFANRQEGMLGENPLAFPTDGLAEGFHVVYLRLGSGQEATLRNYLFYKETSTEEWTTPVPFAYWFDHDADNVCQGVLPDTPMQFDANALAEGEHSVDILIGSGAEATARSFTFYRTPSAVHVYDTVCGQRSWRDTTYTASAIVDGGDTVLHLTVLPTYLHADTVVAVEQYQWHDSLYTASTTDTLHFTTAVGCDSSVVLHLALTGWPDNVADADCKTAVAANDFDMTLLFHCDSAHSMGTPLVADLDGDGLPEIVAASAFPNPANDCDAMHSMGFHIYSGQDGGLIRKVATPRYPIHGQSWAIADVDADRHAEIFLLCSNGHIYCYNHDGTLRYTTQDSVGHRYILQVADLNNDGIAELVCGPYIFRADNGTLLLHGTMDASGMGMGAPHGDYECVGNEYYLCALGDMDGDGTLELCAGGCIYKIDINNPSGTEGNTWSVLRQVDNHIAGTAVANLDGQTVLLDFDGDGDLDVCVVGISHALNFGTTLHYITPYVWDGQTSEVIAAAGIAVRHQFGASIPYCGDLGGDGKPELTFAITGTSAAGGGMYSFCYNPGSYLNMQLVHRHIPFAETAGFTVFDFNQDCKDELVYRGTTQLYIVDGTSLANLTTPLANHSGTVAEYPVVADANADGHAEILVANAYTAYSTPASAMGRVSVYGSATPGAWSSARKVWNQWAYNSVCINEDMTVPRYRFDLGTTFPGGKRPFNAFLKQMPYMDRDGNLFTPLPDAVATEAWAVSAAEGVQLVLGYCNTGDALLASHRVEVYLNEVSDNPLYTLEGVPPLAADSCTTLRFRVPRSLVDSVSSSDSLVLAIATRQQDCNPENNAIAIGHLPLLAHSDSVIAYAGEPIDIDPSLNDSNACDHPTYTIVTAPRHGNAFVGSGSNEGAGGGGGLDELDGPSASPTVGYVSVREGMGEWGEEPHWYYGVDSLRIAIRCNDSVFDTSWIYIHVKPKPEVVSVCDSLRWRDSLYTASGLYTDGDHELNLTVNPSYRSVDYISVTDSCLWQGTTYYASTRDTLRLLTAAGCDSVHTLALTVTGWPDNVHDPDCTTEVDTNVFDMVEKFSCAGVSCLSTPLVADLDGDGLPEIIGLASVDQAIMERYFARNLLVFDGRNGSLKYTIATPLISVCGQGVAIADVDGDGKAEIFVRAQEANNGGRVYCYNHDGTGRWISAEAVDDNFLLTPADIMGDGHTQLVCGPYIFNASDGTLLLHGTFQVGGTGFGAPHNNGNINGTYAGINNALPYYMYAMGDLDHDGHLELCAGKYVYRITLTNYAGLSGNTWAVYNTATTADILEPDGQTFLADFDGDGTLDICVLGIPTTMHYNTWQECTKWKNGKCISYRTVVDKTDSYNLSVYAWNAVTGEVIAYNNKSVSQVAGPAIPFCGDLDGDGLPEILTETDEGTYIYYFDTASSGSMAFTQITSMSGTPGYTAFDFNQDGRYEVVWRGMSDLAIMDGQKIKQNTPPFNVGTSLVAYSGTIAEYPVVADVDGDGHAELLVSRGYWAWTPNNHHDYGCISVYTSATLGAWNSARKVWNNWAFDNALVNEDLSVPQHPFNTATRFPNGKQPLNGFRLPVPNIDRDGNLYNPAADLELVQVEEVQMEDDSIRLSLQLRNNGDATLLAPFGISVYGHSYRGPLLMVDSLSTALRPDSSVTCTLSVPLAILCSLSEGDSLLIAVNDKGLGIAQHGGQQGECDTANNTAVIPTPAFHSSSDTAAVVCDSLAWNGTVYTQSGDFTRSLTNASGCDSTVTLHLTVNRSVVETTAVSTAEPYLWRDSTYSQSSCDTLRLLTTAGCDSLFILNLSVTDWPDNIDSAACTTIPEGYAWSIAAPVVSQTGVSHGTTPLVADIDGDGNPEIIALGRIDGNTTPHAACTHLLVFRPDGTIKNSIALAQVSPYTSTPAVARVRWDESTDTTIIVVQGGDISAPPAPRNHLYAYDAAGHLLWTSDQPFSSAGELCPLPAISFADFNHDGYAEVYAGRDIFDAATGKLLCRGDGNLGIAYRGWSKDQNPYSSVAADLCVGGNLELAVGNTVYNVVINSRTDTSANSVTPVRSVQDMLMCDGQPMYMQWTSGVNSLHTDGNTFLVDINADGRLDVLVMYVDGLIDWNNRHKVGKNWVDEWHYGYLPRVINIYVWDVSTQEVICSKKITNAREFSLPQIGDIDGDGLPEVNFLVSTYYNHDVGNNEYIYSLKYDPQSPNNEMTVFWRHPHSDNSGATGLTLFDFNQDGIAELVYRDVYNLHIINGSRRSIATGQPIAAPEVITSFGCTSGTCFEYPVVADIAGDGQAEIVVVSAPVTGAVGYSRQNLCIFHSGASRWAPARKVWNQYLYNPTGVNEDLTVPRSPFYSAHRFTDPEGVVRQPYNNLLQQATSVDRHGRPFTALPDIVATGAYLVNDGDSVTLQVDYCNQGDAPLAAPWYITANSFRDGQPTPVRTDTIATVLGRDSCGRFELRMPHVALCGIDSILFTLNTVNDGSTLTGTIHPECDTTNNTVAVPSSAFLSVGDTTAVVCDSLAWYGTVYTQSGEFTHTLTNAAGCDSTVTLHLTVGTSYSDTLVATIQTGDSILFEGRHYRLAGTYTDTLHTAAGCDSLHTLSLRVSTRICPEVTNTGTDFWVGYLYNYPELEFGVFEPTILHFLEAASEEDADLIVTNPLTGWSTTAHIAAGGSVILTIPNNITSSTANFSPQPHGIHVTSSAPVTLYATNWMLGSTDITAILPTEALRWHYIIQDYPGQRGAQAALLAVEDSTLITITPPVGVSGCALSQPISVMLMAGQKYTLWHGSLSFTGVDVRSDGKPFALFQGNRSAQVPQGVKYADHLYEQAIPVDAWGRDHVIVPTPLRTGGDRIKVTSADDNCLVLLDGDTLVTLGRGQTHEFHMPSGPAHRLVSSRPVSVVQFLTGIKKDGTRGDPSQVQIAPIEQGLCRVSFVVFNPPFTLSLYRQYINIVTTLSDLDSLMLDGNPIGQQFTPLDSLYCYAKISVTPGPHTLVSGTGTFTATIYGLRDSESHAYCAGMALANLRNQLLVDGQEASRYPDGYRACPGDTLHLATAAASGSTNTRWLVDGIEQACGQAPAFDLPCTAPGLHHIAALMHFSADTLRWDDTLRIDIIVGDTSSSVVQADICHGESFGWHDSLYTQPVTALFRTLNAAGCDSTVALHLAVHPTYSDTLAVTVCAGQRYTYEAADYTAAGTYTAALHTAAGCDSLRTLCLKVLPTSSGDTLAVVCDSFTWYGEQYTASTDAPTHLLTAANGCDSTVTLHLTVNHSNEAVETLTACNSLVWHGTEYTASTSAPTFTSVNAEGCDSVTTLHLTVNHCSTTEITTCDSYLWNGTTYTASGTYTVGTDTLLLTVLHSTAADTTAVVCDSFSWYGVQYTASIDSPTHLLTNAAGCDSTVTLHLTVNHSTAADTLVVVCDSFSWHGVQYTSSTDTPTHLLTNAAGCDSTVTLRLTVNHSSAGIDAVTACGSFVWHGEEYTESTTAPTHTSVNAEGCDSVTTLHLTVHPTFAYSVRDTVVENALPHAFGGAQFVQDVADTLFSFATVEGCDSLVSYSLHVFWNAASTLDSALCNSSLPLVWNGVVFDTSVSTKTTLVRSATFAARGGADSVVVMRLTVHPLYDHHHYASLCDNQVYDWGGHRVWDTGNLGSRRNGSDTLLHLTDSLLSAFGCDSVSSLHLTVHPTYDHHLADTLCTSQPYAWGTPQRQVQEPYSVERSLHGRDSLAAQASAAVDTSFADQLVSVFGCDSVSSLHLHLLPSYRLTFADTICADTFYRFAGQEYSATGSYPQSLSTADGCDSIRTLALKVYPVYDIHVYDAIRDGDLYHFEQSAYDTTGVYPHLLQTGSGCDSLRTLHLQRNWRSYNDSSVCQNAQPLVWNGVVFSQEQGQRRQGYYYVADSVHLAGRAQTDSLVVMRVRILDTSATYDVRHACDSLTWHDGVTYTASTAAPYIVRPNRWQCDSVCHLVLTLDSTHRFVDRRVVCDSLRWLDGTAYLADTLGPQVTLLTAAGCDSVVTLSLAVRYSTEVRLDDTICAMQDYDWHGHHFEHLDVNSYTREHIAMTDSLATTEGCDSTVTMHLVKMALPSFGYSVEHDCVSGNVDVTASALYELDGEDYPLMMPYLRWRAVPHDPLLDGQQGMAAITVHPEAETDYVLYAAYTEAGLCRDSMHLRLSPVRVPEAEIRVLPMALTFSQLDYTAYDVSTHDYQERVWRVDGVIQAEVSRTLTGTASPTADTVRIELELYNGQCRDTALALVPVQTVALFAPDIFTPGRESNNRFFIGGQGILDGELYVYNRDGLLVYRTADFRTGWDGRRADGTLCPQAAYVWKFVYHAVSQPDAARVEVGTVTLVH